MKNKRNRLICIIYFKYFSFQEEKNEEPPPAAKANLKPASSAAIKSPTPGRQYGVPEVPKSIQRRAEHYSGGKPSKHDKEKLMRSEGIIPIQAGSNKYASQRGMTGKLKGKSLTFEGNRKFPLFFILF